MNAPKIVCKISVEANGTSALPISAPAKFSRKYFLFF